MSNGVWFASESGGQGIWALSESAAGVPTISSIDPGETDAIVTWTGTATHYRIDGGTTTSLPDGTSPDTITGLTANTEYTSPGLELSGDGGTTWSDPVAFGTDNPGSGGGGIPTLVLPSAGSIAVTGYVPTVARTQNQSVAPAAGTVVVAGAVPTVSQTTAGTVSPAAGVIAVTGRVPTVAQTRHVTVAPATGVVAVVGYVPTVLQVPSSPTLTPAAGSVVVRGGVPAVTQAAPAPTAPSGGGAYGVDLKRRLRLDRERNEAELAEVAELLMALAAAGVLD